MPSGTDLFGSLTAMAGLPSGNFFSDPRLPPGLRSTGSYMPRPNRATGTSGGAAGAAGSSPAGVPALPDYSEIGDLIAEINAGNQAAQHSANLGRIPGAGALEAASSAGIMDLFDPNPEFAEIDVGGAARGVASGTVGSPFAGVTSLNLNENERLRRFGLGQQFLSGAYGRNPAAPIADAMGLVSLLQNQRFQAGETAADRALRRELARREQETALAIAAMRGSGRYGTDGGGYYGPRLPTSYGRPAAAPAATFRAGIPDETDFSGFGTGELLSMPAGYAPENWADLPFDLQADYAAALQANPYYNTPDQYNPYAAEYDPDVSFGASY